MKFLDVIKGRVLLVVLPVLGLLLGFVLAVLFWPALTKAPDPVLIAITGTDTTGYLANLGAELRKSPRVKVVDRRLFDESLGSTPQDRPSLMARRAAAQRF